MIKADFMKAMEIIYDSAISKCTTIADDVYPRTSIRVSFAGKSHEIAITSCSSAVMRDLFDSGLDVRFHRADLDDGVIPIIKVGVTYDRERGQKIPRYHNLSPETIQAIEQEA